MKQNINTTKAFLPNTKVTNQRNKCKTYNFTQPMIIPSPNRSVAIRNLMIATKAYPQTPECFSVSHLPQHFFVVTVVAASYNWWLCPVCGGNTNLHTHSFRYHTYHETRKEIPKWNMFAVTAVSKSNMQCSRLTFNGVGTAIKLKLNVNVLRFSIFLTWVCPSRVYVLKKFFWSYK